jgi:cytochrome c6
MRNPKCRDTRSSLIKVSGVAIMVVALISVCFPVTAGADDAAGSATFKAKCAMCHGADGAGKTPMGAKLNIPNLVSPETQKKADTSLVEVIAKGKNKMPEFGSKLSADQITQVKDYIREIAKKH